MRWLALAWLPLVAACCPSAGSSACAQEELNAPLAFPLALLDGAIVVLCRNGTCASGAFGDASGSAQTQPVALGACTEADAELVGSSAALYFGFDPGSPCAPPPAAGDTFHLVITSASGAVLLDHHHTVVALPQDDCTPCPAQLDLTL